MDLSSARAGRYWRAASRWARLLASGRVKPGIRVFYGHDLVPAGTSVRYTAMTALGLERAAQAGFTPTIEVELDPDLLWPPNHNMNGITAEVTATGVFEDGAWVGA